MKVVLINNQNKLELDLDSIKEAATYISNKFDKNSRSELNIIFSDKEGIRKLNKKYRNIDKETDVLSFSYLADREKMGLGAGNYTIGEIIICPEVAGPNALSQDGNWSLNLEIVLLVIHGMLHIYNYDHIEEKDRSDMESIQDNLISDVRKTFNL